MDNNHPANPIGAEVIEALEALNRSREGWENAVEMGIIPPQHRAAATILADECRKAAAALSQPVAAPRPEGGAVAEALRELEDACNELAATRGRETYLSMIERDNAADALHRLDRARLNACAIIAALKDKTHDQ